LALDINTAGLPRYIAVEGPIGVGKTTLAKNLAQSFNYEVLLESPETNPFLERFYKSPQQAALPAQLFFLFERARQIQELRQGDMFQPALVADFIIEKDRLFAEINLDADELKLYENIHQHLIVEAPVPDLVIYLQAPADVLLKRIHKRGVRIEQDIEKPYITQLVDAYTKLFHYYSASPLLIVNATEIDLTHSTADYDDLLQFMRTVKTGRHYYNPTQAMF
jgi:deoxyadenosine/deoxycytidine kinase